VQSRVNDAVQKFIDQQVAIGNEIGVQVAAYHQGERIVDCWAGTVAHDSQAKVDGDTLFNVFSVSKAIVDVALHIQIERGLVELDAPVAKYWPEFAQNGKSGVTVAHVLYHRSGVPHLPDDITPERLGDWSWMTSEIARLSPLFDPGSRTAYQCMSQGWMLGEIICRTDPARRSYRDFVIEEICVPLKALDLHHGITDAEEPRIASLYEPEKTHFWAADTLFRQSIPLAVDLGPAVWERPDVRRATVPSVGGIFTARSEARFWAMIAERGELDGVRILKRETVESFLESCAVTDEGPDPVISMPYIPLGKGGLWLGTNFMPGAPARNARTLIKPGYGHSVGIADMDNRLSVAICHNYLFNPPSIQECHNTPIIDIVRDTLDMAY
jgi:CubicO group peptidase (beta-lactamase class C family)